METLNSDCLSQVFLHLDFIERVKLETVCSFWHAILQQNFMYSDMTDLDIAKFLMSDTSEYYQQESINFLPTVLGILKRCGPYVQRLSFGQMWLRISQPIIDCIAQNCRRVEKLDLGATIVNADISQLLVQLSPQLREFSLEETSWVDNDYTRQLQELFSKMPRLEKVNLRSANFDLSKLASLAPSLTYLDISGARRFEAYVICEFLESHPHLQQLHMCPAPVLDDRVLASLQRCADSLTHLSLGFVYQQLNFDALCALDNLTHLRLQNMHNLTEMSLQLMLACMPRLRQLEILHCINVLDYSSLALCPNLEALEITETHQLTNEHFVSMAANKLKSLRLAKCMNLSTRGITDVLTRCQLHELNINFCTEMTDEVMYTLASTQCELEKISIQGCMSITSKGVSALAWLRNVRKLREADVSKNRNVDDAVVQTLHNALTMASRIDAAKCNHNSNHNMNDDDDDGDAKPKMHNQKLVMYIFHTSITPAVGDQVKDLISLL